MARKYPTLDDASEVEKSVGGILTFGQTAWIGLGLIIAGGIFVLLCRTINPIIALIMGLIPGAAIAIPFAFYEKDGLRFTQYLSWQHKFRKKNKQLVNTLTYRIDRKEDFEREEKGKESEFL